VHGDRVLASAWRPIHQREVRAQMIPAGRVAIWPHRKIKALTRSIAGLILVFPSRICFSGCRLLSLSSSEQYAVNIILFRRLPARVCGSAQYQRVSGENTMKTRTQNIRPELGNVSSTFPTGVAVYFVPRREPARARGMVPGGRLGHRGNLRTSCLSLRLWVHAGGHGRPAGGRGCN
jgi:hypothetical protein